MVRHREETIMATWILVLSTLLGGIDPEPAALGETGISVDDGPRYVGIEQMFAKFAIQNR
ncbi:MAG: hypothetical protein ACPG77_19525 [Nannocystaceae bacterium]